MSDIDIDRMFELLSDAYPAFKPLLADHLQEWRDEEPLYENSSFPMAYLAAGDLADLVIEQFNSSQSKSLEALFSAIETCYLRGSPDAQEVLTIGLLEGIQNIWLAEDRGDWTPLSNMLGQKTLLEWNKVVSFWEEGKIITSDR